ncbi:MAG: hypothetical protein Q9179_000931 [Wetmoreana sp. 5 TL-2023]
MSDSNIWISRRVASAIDTGQPQRPPAVNGATPHTARNQFADPERLLVSQRNHRRCTSNARQTPGGALDHSSKHGPDFDVPGSASSRQGILTGQRSKEIPRHSRSLSHPLTSLFGHGKKAGNPNRNETSALDRDNQDEPLSSSPSDMMMGGLLGVSARASMPKAQDMEIGKCATCDSMVKWPKHLCVFRCTICLMVNDLRPLEFRSREVLDKRNSDTCTYVA